jgi:hypothetical protein
MGRRFLYRRKKTRWQERRKRRRLKQKLHHQTKKKPKHKKDLSEKQFMESIHIELVKEGKFVVHIPLMSLSPKNNCVAQILTPFSFGRWISMAQVRTSVALVYFVTVCSSVGWFFDFSKNCQFQVFEKKSETKNQPVLVI